MELKSPLIIESDSDQELLLVESSLPYLEIVMVDIRSGSFFVLCPV